MVNLGKPKQPKPEPRSIIRMDDTSYVVYQAHVDTPWGSTFLSVDTEAELLTTLCAIVPRFAQVTVELDILKYEWLISKLKKRYNVLVTRKGDGRVAFQEKHPRDICSDCPKQAR